MEYLPEDQLCPIDKSVLSDLELIECTKQVNDTSSTNNESNATSKPMYAHVFQPQSAFAKRYLGMWAKQFTTSVPHLQDTQRFIAAVSKDKDNCDFDFDKVETIWARIKTDASFRDKFNYIDYAPLDALNRSPTFLQCYSMYNLFSPLLSFLMPVIMLIVPFFILKLQRVAITLPTYFGIIKMMLSQHAVGKLIFDMSAVSWDKRVYILVSVIFYVVQMYQNVVSCHRFYRNTYLVHADLAAIRAYADATIKKMRQFAGHALACGDTFGPFAADLQRNREQLERMVAALDRIDPPALTAKKCLQIGYVMQQYYAVFSDAGIAACVQYSFGFNAFAEHVAHFGELLRDNKVAACEFVVNDNNDNKDDNKKDNNKKDKDNNKNNKDKDKDKKDKDNNKKDKTNKDNNKNKKDNDNNKKDKDNNKKDNTHTKIVNGYYVATALNDGTSPVKNTVSLDKRLVITGPNASGKTTILKMTMLNILFSQQLGHGFYEEGKQQASAQWGCGGQSPPGQSPPVRHFCIFDELYSGTNPYEAIASAYGYITHLTKHVSVDFMLTTHYIQLCKLFEESDEAKEPTRNHEIRNLHMEVADRGNYDFKYLYALHPGISAIKGGIKVLYDLQYPASIVDATRRILSVI